MKVESAGAEEGGLEVGQEEGQTEVRYRSPVQPSHTLVRKTDTLPWKSLIGWADQAPPPNNARPARNPRGYVCA